MYPLFDYFILIISFINRMKINQLMKENIIAFKNSQQLHIYVICEDITVLNK